MTGFIGTLFVGKLLNKTLFPILIGWPFTMSMIGLGFISFGSDENLTILMVAAWGFIGTSACVGWYVWLAKVAPNDSEQGGGLMIAVIQLAITLGASCGGILYDHSGYKVTFSAGAAILLLAAVLSFVAYLIRHSTKAMN